MPAVRNNPGQLNEGTMNLYFSCSITGGRQDEDIYGALVDFLIENGHEVPTAILSRPEVMGLESDASPQEVYLRDVAWVEGCDAVVAEISTPSHGVGYEIALALTLGKPVLCLYRADRRVSKMLTGNTHQNIRVSAYETPIKALEITRDFLKGL
jgi:nucleoside 2-deoxyribosyltransferase